jgi:hypothetical protein
MLLTDKQILKAFDGDFGEIAFDHQPTAEDIFLVKLKLVAKAVDKVRTDWFEREIEKYKVIRGMAYDVDTDGIEIESRDWQAIKDKARGG